MTCAKCAIENHKKHDVLTISELHQAKQAELEKTLAILKSKEESLQTKKKDYQQCATEVTSQCTQARGMINKSFEEITQKLAERKNKLMSIIDDIEKKALYSNTQLDDCLANLKSSAQTATT